MRRNIKLVAVLTFAVAVALAAIATTTWAAAPLLEKTGKGESTWENEKKEIVHETWASDERTVKPGPSKLEVPSGNTFFGFERGGVKCHSAGAKEGEVKTSALTETFGFVNKAKSEVGLETKASEGELFAKYTCGETSVEIRGAVIGSISPVNKLIEVGQAFSRKYSQEGGKQGITKFEGGSEVSLEVSVNKGSFRRAGFQDSGELFAAEPSEIVTSPTLEFKF